MPFKRIIGSIVVKNGIAVQSFKYNHYLPIGKPEIVAKYLYEWGVDEIAILDIDRSRMQLGPDLEMLKKVSKKSFVPLSYAGGIRNDQDAIQVIASGADKIILNQLVFKDSQMIKKISSALGSQSIVGSVVYSMVNNTPFAFNYLSQETTQFSLIEICNRFLDADIGELLLSNKENDGSRSGFDIKHLSSIANEIGIPIIAASGASSASDVAKLFSETKVEACAIGNIFNYQEHAAAVIKSLTKKTSISNKIRFTEECPYLGHNFSKEGRILKASDKHLENLLYQKITKESI